VVEGKHYSTVKKSQNGVAEESLVRAAGVMSTNLPGNPSFVICS